LIEDVLDPEKKIDTFIVAAVENINLNIETEASMD